MSFVEKLYLKLSNFPAINIIHRRERRIHLRVKYIMHDYEEEISFHEYIYIQLKAVV